MEHIQKRRNDREDDRIGIMDGYNPFALSPLQKNKTTSKKVSADDGKGSWTPSDRRTKGIMANTKGIMANTKGIMANTKGIMANPKDQDANPRCKSNDRKNINIFIIITTFELIPWKLELKECLGLAGLPKGFEFSEKCVFWCSNPDRRHRPHGLYNTF